LVILFTQYSKLLACFVKFNEIQRLKVYTTLFMRKERLIKIKILPIFFLTFLANYFHNF